MREFKASGNTIVYSLNDIFIGAFANTQGGRILIGVTDKGELSGVDDIHGLNQTISNAASGKLEPPLNVTTENVLCNDKPVVIINVPRGENKPYAANRTDYWIKVGADKRRATREELRRLMQACGTIYADEMIIPGTSVDDIDMFVFRDFYEREYGMSLEQSALPLEKLVANLKLLKEGNLTLAGLLIFGAKPSRIRPQYVIKAVAFPGADVSGNEYLDSGYHGLFEKKSEKSPAGPKCKSPGHTGDSRDSPGRGRGKCPGAPGLFYRQQHTHIHI